MASIILQVEVKTALTASQEAFRARYAGQGHTVTVIASGETPAGGVDAHALIVNASTDAPPSIAATPRGFLVLTADADSGPNITKGSSFGFNNRGSSGAPAAKFGSGVVPRDTATTTSQQLYETSQPVYYYTDGTWTGTGAVPVLAAHSTTTTRWAGGYIPAGGALQDGTAAAGPRGWWLPTNLHLMVEAAWVILDNHVAYLLVPPAANTAPTANAGPDATLLAGESLVRVGTGTDPDGTVQSYTWTVVSVPAGSTVTSTTSGANLTVNTDVAGAYVFRLRVTDELGVQSAPDDFTVTATAPAAFTGGPVVDVVGAHVVTGGVLRHASGTTGRVIVRRTTAQASGDHEATVTVAALTGGVGLTSEVGVCVGMNAGDAACYNLAVDIRGRWNLYRRAADGSVAETLASNYEFTPPAAPFDVRLARAGDALTGWVGGVQVATASAVGTAGVHAGISLFRSTTGEVADASALATAATTPAVGTPPGTPIPYVLARGYNRLEVEALPVDGADRYLLSLNGTPRADSNGPQFTIDGLTDNTTYTVGIAARGPDGATSPYGTVQVVTWPYTGIEIINEDGTVQAVVLEMWDTATSAWVGGPTPDINP